MLKKKLEPKKKNLMSKRKEKKNNFCKAILPVFTGIP